MQISELVPRQGLREATKVATIQSTMILVAGRLIVKMFPVPPSKVCGINQDPLKSMRRVTSNSDQRKS